MARLLHVEGDESGRAATDAALVARVRRGDAAALEALFRAYATPLRAFAARLVTEREVAHEIVQDVFLAIWSQRATWVVTGSVSTYLFQAIKHRALNVVRRDQVHRRFESGAASGTLAEWLGARPPSADALAQDRELADAVRRAVDRLPSRVRAVFRLAREEERSYAEVAAKLGISVPTVERDMAKAVEALRRELAAWRSTRR